MSGNQFDALKKLIESLTSVEQVTLALALLTQLDSYSRIALTPICQAQMNKVNPHVEGFEPGRWVTWKDRKEAKKKGHLDVYGEGPFEIYKFLDFEGGAILQVIFKRTRRPPVTHIGGFSSEFFKLLEEEG